MKRQVCSHRDAHTPSLARRQQVMDAVRLRAQTNISGSDRTIVNQIIHSGDTMGQYKDEPNPFRDPGFRFDRSAQVQLDRLKRKWF
jgi:hypothetical protein